MEEKQPEQDPREYGLDWLRVIAFGVLILYHTGMFFVPWTWHVKNPETSEGLAWIMLFFSRWRLPLLFFISGCGVAFALRKRTLAAFTTERVKRLFVPLLFGIFVVVPPQIYFERRTQGVPFAGYSEFYSTVFRFIPYPEGNFSWHHLWFVAYLLVYSIVLLPVFAWLRSESGKAWLNWIGERCSRPACIYAVGIPSLVLALTLGPRWPTTHNLISDWANLLGSMVTFLWGFIFASNPKLLEILERRRMEWLVGAVAFTILFYTQRIGRFDWGRFLTEFISSTMGMLWIFTLVGHARHSLNRDSALLRYANEAVYPFYIVHQTITVAAGYYLAGWSTYITIKFAAIASITFLGSWILLELAKRFTLTRLVFGLKARPSPG